MKNARIWVAIIGAKDDGNSIGSAEHVLGEGGSGSNTNLHLHFICDIDFLVLLMVCW